MGKNTDKLYVTASEWMSGDHSASGGVTARKQAHAFKRLPYNYCALSLQPFEHPVMTSDGTIFDIRHIVPWLKKHGTNPVTGGKLEAKDLIKLTFGKNEAGENCDPVTFKVFTDNTHLVAIKTSGNVFTYDTVQRLNIKAKNWHDLVTDEEFTKKDIVTIQDPHNLQQRDMSTFKYLQEGKSTPAQDAKEEEAKDLLSGINTAATGSAAKILKARQAVADLRSKSTTNPNTNPALHKPPPKPYNAAIYTTGMTAASLTSTSITPQTSTNLAILSEEDYLLVPKRVRHKGYARIQTTHGSLNIELDPLHAPKAVYNFVQLSKAGKYNGVVFHRNIPGFMIQGGDPTGTGRGGKSFWGKDFADELGGPRRHDERGTLSVANRGKNTNSSQFFITYGPASHLDNKHTIFGRVVGGMEVLDALERVPVDSGDRPVREVKMVDVVVYIDPFEEFHKERLEKEEREQREAEEAKIVKEDDVKTWTGRSVAGAKNMIEAPAAGVGKYLAEALKQQQEGSGEGETEGPVKKKRKAGGFGDFSSW
ncbi:cyclophilin peptidyl-prolyl cis-trans isomerase Cyp8 [Saitoella coloradoensis]